MADTEQTRAQADTERLFTAAGTTSTPDGRRKARERLNAADARTSPDVWANLRDRLGVQPA